MNETFTGSEKHSTFFLEKYQKEVVTFLVNRAPRWLDSFGLTLASVFLSGLIVLTGYLSTKNSVWLVASSVIILVHWLADSCDGPLGKMRGEGLQRWGFHMDHFLDYVFLISLVVSYSFLFSYPVREYVYMFVPIFGGFMINSYLAFGATGKLRVTYFYIGPTEMQIALALINFYIIFVGVNYIQKVLPFLVLFFLLVLMVVVFRTQKEIIEIDRKKL